MLKLPIISTCNISTKADGSLNTVSVSVVVLSKWTINYTFWWSIQYCHEIKKKKIVS